MHPFLKSALRFALGAAILVVGVVIMKGLISLKEELPVSDRPTPARAVRVVPVAIASTRAAHSQLRAVSKHAIAQRSWRK